MFRFAMHALGGLGLIVVALSFGLFGRGGGASLFSSEGRSEHVVPNVVQTTQFIARITLVIVSVATVIITALCLLMGMEPTRAFLNALWVSTSGFVTGGFTPMQLSIMYYHSFPLEAILMVLMILGSISFVIHAEVWKGRPLPFFRDIETKTMVLWIGVMAFVFTATLALSPFDDMLALLRRGLFMIISAFTTTGFQVVTTNQITTAFSNGAFLTLAFIMAVGGASGSTAGGIKFSRMGIIFKSIVSNVKEALAPDSARVVVSYNHVGRRTLTPEIVKEAMTAFIMAVGGASGSTAGGIKFSVRDHLRYRRAGGHCTRVRGHSRNLRVGGHDVQRRHHHVGGGARHGGNSRAVLHLPDVGRTLGVHDAVRPYCGSGGLPGAAASTEGALMRLRGIALLAIALAAVLAAPGPVAWATGAANGATTASSDGGVTNEDVPTDDTGVVEAGEGAGNEGAGNEGADGGAVQGGGAEGEGASGGATEGENGADGEDGQAVDKPARPKLPDPVFGEDVSEDNLVNPQQKPDSSFIYDTSISALQEADSYLNNQTVQVTGEVIGDRIRAEFDPGYSWIVLQGSDRAHSEIPVFMDTESTEVIDTYGAYGRKGTTLQVRGTFHLICPEHEGLTDLHADAVTFVEKGSVTEQPFDIGAFLPGLMLVAIGFIMLIVFHQMREGQR